MREEQATTNPRLWGEWQPQFYGSGTTIVVLRAPVHKPYLYVCADVAADEDRTQSQRYLMCRELAAYMNGGERPKWLDDMERVSETQLKSLSGADISATGPLVDRDPPKLLWVQDESDQAVYDRAKLMDVLCGVSAQREETP